MYMYVFLIAFPMSYLLKHFCVLIFMDKDMKNTLNSIFLLHCRMITEDSSYCDALENHDVDCTKYISVGS